MFYAVYEKPEGSPVYFSVERSFEVGDNRQIIFQTDSYSSARVCSALLNEVSRLVDSLTDSVTAEDITISADKNISLGLYGKMDASGELVSLNISRIGGVGISEHESAILLRALPSITLAELEVALKRKSKQGK